MTTLQYPGHGSAPFTAGEVFWLNFPAIIFSVMSLFGCVFIIGSYLYMERLKTIVDKLVAWLSFTDLCLVFTMSISIITAASQGQVAYIYAQNWFPIIQITNFFITASWLWSAAIAFASLNVGSFTMSKEREDIIMRNIHIVVWTLSVVLTVVLTVLNDGLKAPVQAFRIQALFGLFIYVWNVILFIFVLSRIRIITKEFVFIEEKKKMRNMMVSLVIYLVPFVICWSVFIVCSMITFRASFNSKYAAQFGFWTLIFMICLPPLQGACNALAFGITTFEGPRRMLQRLFFKKTSVGLHEPTNSTNEPLPIAYYDDEESVSYKSIIAVPVEKDTTLEPLISPKPTPIIAPPPPMPQQFRASVYLIYFNSFLYYFSIGMKLMVKWTYVEALKGSLFDFGCTMAAFGLGWALSAIPSAAWARKYNTKQVLIGTTLMSFLGSILWAVASNPAMLIVSRFFSGMAAGNITVGRSFLASVSTPETRTVIMANSSAASMLGSVLGPALSLAISYSSDHILRMGRLHLHFNQYTYPGWVVIVLCIGYTILLALLFKEPPRNSNAALPPPKLTAPIILCGSLICMTLCFLSFFETISLPIMIIIFHWTIPQACAVWIALGSASFVVQLVVIRIMNQLLKIEDRLGIFLGLCIGLFGSLVLTGYVWQCSITSMLIGSVAIVSISGSFLFTFSLALIAKFLGRSTIHYLGHIFAAGAVGRIIGPIWAVAASTKFTSIGLSLDGISPAQLNSLLPFAGCSVMLLIAFIMVLKYYKKLVP